MGGVNPKKGVKTRRGGERDLCWLMRRAALLVFPRPAAPPGGGEEEGDVYSSRKFVPLSLHTV